MEYEQELTKYRKETKNIHDKCNCVICHERMQCMEHRATKYSSADILERVLSEILEMYLDFYSHCGYKMDLREHFTSLFNVLLLRGSTSEGKYASGYLKSNNLPYRRFIRKTIDRIWKTPCVSRIKCYKIITDLAHKIQIFDFNGKQYRETLKKIKQNVKNTKKLEEEKKQKAIVDELKSELTYVSEELRVARDKLRKLQDDDESPGSIPQRLNKVIADLRAKVSSLETIQANTVKLNEEVVAEREKLRQQLADALKSNSQLRNANIVLDENMHTLRNQLADLEYAANQTLKDSDISDMEAKLMKAEAERDTGVAVNAALVHENSRAKEDLTILRTTCERLRIANELLDNDVRALEKKIVVQEKLSDKLEEDNVILQGEIAALQKENSLGETKIKKLEEEIDELRKAKLEAEQQVAEKSDLMTAKGRLEDKLRAILNDMSH